MTARVKAARAAIKVIAAALRKATPGEREVIAGDLASLMNPDRASLTEAAIAALHDARED